MKARNYVVYKVSLLVSILAFGFSALPCYATAEVLFDPDGYMYDVMTGNGTCLYEGTNNAYDTAYYLRINGVKYNAESLTTSGRNIIGTAETLSGLRVTRKLYVPEFKNGELGNFGRWYDTLYNPTGFPITVNVEYVSNLGSDGATQVTLTDDNDNVIETSDQWLATDDELDGGGDPSLAHVVYLTGADEPIDYIELYDVTGYGADYLDWRTWLFLYLVFAIGLQVAPSSEDFRALPRALALVVVMMGGCYFLGLVSHIDWAALPIVTDVLTFLAGLLMVLNRIFAYSTALILLALIPLVPLAGLLGRLRG